MAKNVDITGERFGRLVAIERAQNESGSKDRHSLWLCQCDCGKTVLVKLDKLRGGDTKSCGCYKRDLCAERIKKFNEAHPKARRKHGQSGKKLYWAYQHMMARCYNETNERFSNYGGRGISVCDEWRKNPTSFIEWSLQNGFCDDLTLDRINVDGNYEPTNCRWVDWKTQRNNKTTSVYITVNGQKLTLALLSEKYGIPLGTVWWRYHNGWTPENIIKPVRGYRNEN